MATNAEYIQARIDAVHRELAETDWGPDVSDQGRSIQKVAYRKSLLDELKVLREELIKEQGPFTVFG